MVGQRMPRVEPQRLVERSQCFLRARMRFTGLFPQIPRPQHHHGIGKPRRDVGVARVGLIDLTHRGHVGFVERASFGFLVAGEPGRHRPNQGLLRRGRRRGKILRLRQRLPGQLGPRGGNAGAVDVRTAGQRHAPPRHGAFGIEARRVLHRTQPFVVVEPGDKCHALVEIALSLGFRTRDNPRMRADIREQRRRHDRRR